MPDPAPTPPPPTAPPAPPAAPQADPFLDRILADMGKVAKDGVLQDAPPAAPEEGPKVTRHEFTSMGEIARSNAEKAEKAAAAPPAPPADPAPTPAPAPLPPAIAEGTPAPAEPAKPRPITVEKEKPLEEVVEGVIRRIQDSAANPPAAKTPEPSDPNEAYIATRDEGQKEEIELARFAAKQMPDRYGKMPERLVQYYKKVDDYIETKQKEDPDWSHESDPEYATFKAKNQPAYLGVDRKKIERAQITAQTTADVEARLNPRIEENERRNRAQDIRPEVEKAVTSFAATVTARMAPDDTSPLAPVIAAAKEKGWDAAMQVDPLAAAVLKNVTDEAVALVRDYLELATGVKEPAVYDPKRHPNDVQNQTAIRQSKLSQFIDHEEANFVTQGGTLKTVNGQSFLPRREYFALPQDQQARHWTLRHNDVLEMLAYAAGKQAKNAYTAETSRLTAAGYVKAPPTPPPKAPEPVPPAAPAPAASPRATSSTSPGAAAPTPPPSAETLMSAETLKRMQGGGHASWS